MAANAAAMSLLLLRATLIVAYATEDDTFDGAVLPVRSWWYVYG